MIELETERLIIRNFTAKDWQELYEVAMDYEKSVLAKYDHGPWPTDLEEHKKIVEMFSLGDDYVAVVLKESEKLIGFIAKGEKKDKRYEYGFGYIFHSNYHGKGYATESCKAVLKHMFEELGAEKVSAGTAKNNLASNALLKRLGFKVEGEKARSFRKDKSGRDIEFIGVDYSISRLSR